jgi:hypothetical protein
MTPTSSAYTASRAASARGTATGRDGGSETAGLTTPSDVGQRTTGRLTVTNTAVVAEAGPLRPAVDGPGDEDRAFPAGAPQPATSVSGTVASSAAAIGQRCSQPCR